MISSRIGFSSKRNSSLNMKYKVEANETYCGCQTSMTLHSNKSQSRLWTDSISFHSLEEDLGSSSKTWFGSLGNEQKQVTREIIPANGQIGWSPCPSGGTLNFSASTPCPLRKAYNHDSPALWPILLPDSPMLESTPLSESISSEDIDPNNSTIVSLGFHLGMNDGGKDNDQLLGLNTDSADLSWSSSMATPSKTAAEKFPVTEEERHKGPARALFSPNISAADSDPGETDNNLSIEQEEASISLFADFAASSPSCLQQENFQNICKNQEKILRAVSHLELKSFSCACEQVPVVEIYCSDKKTALEMTRVQTEANNPCFQAFTPKSDQFKSFSLQEKPPDDDISHTVRRCNSAVLKGSGNQYDFADLYITNSEAKQNGNAENDCWHTPTLEKNSLGFELDVSQTNNSHSSQMPAVDNTSVSEILSSHQVSHRKRDIPKNSVKSCETTKTTPVDEALADFFSSPDTVEKQRKHAPGKAKNKTNSGSVKASNAKDSLTELPVHPDSVKGQVLVHGNITDRSNHTRYMLKGYQLPDEKPGVPAVLIQSCYEEARRTTGTSMEDQKSLMESAKMCSFSGTTFSTQTNSNPKVALQNQLKTCSSSAVEVGLTSSNSTPPSILRTERTPSSHKRVRFAEDATGKASGSKSKVIVKKRLTESDANSRKRLYDHENSSAGEHYVMADNVETEKTQSSSKVVKDSENTMSFSAESNKQLEFQITNANDSGNNDVSKLKELLESFASEEAKSLPKDSLPSSDDAQPYEARITEENIQNQMQLSISNITKLELPVNENGINAGVNLFFDSEEHQITPEFLKNSCFAEPQTHEGAKRKRGYAEFRTQSALNPERKAKFPRGCRNTPCFLYPSSSQILETCAKNVYDFTSSLEHRKSACNPNSVLDSDDKLRVMESSRNSEMAPSAENLAVNNTLSHQTVLVTTSSPVQKVPIEQLKKNTENSEESTCKMAVSENRESTLKVESCWSQPEESYFENLKMNDSPKLKTNLSTEKNKERAGLEVSGLSEYEIKTFNREQKTDPECTLNIYSAQAAGQNRADLNPNSLKEPLSSSVFLLSLNCQANHIADSMMHCTDSSTKVFTAVQSEQDDLLCKVETVNKNQQADLESDLQNELLCDVNFSQDLLSQSKSDYIVFKSDTRTVSQPVSFSYKTAVRPDIVLGQNCQAKRSDSLECNLSAINQIENGLPKRNQLTVKSNKELKLQGPAELEPIHSLSSHTAESSFQQGVGQDILEDSIFTLSACTRLASVTEKTVNQAEKALNTAQVLKNSISVNSSFGSKNTYSEIFMDKDRLKANFSFTGFKNANGQVITVSSKGQRKAEEMWKTVEKNLQGEEYLNSNSISNTDANENIKTMPRDRYYAACSEEPTSASGWIDHTRNSVRRSDIMLNEDHTGFKTASGKAMSITDRAQQKALKLWEDVKRELKSGIDTHSEAHLAITGQEKSDRLSKTRVDLEDKCTVSREFNKPFNSSLLAGQSYSNVLPTFSPNRSQLMKELKEENNHQVVTAQAYVSQENVFVRQLSPDSFEEKNMCSKQKRSDDFSDDGEDMWEVEIFEPVGRSKNSQTSEAKKAVYQMFDFVKKNNVQPVNNGESFPAKLMCYKLDTEVGMQTSVMAEKGTLHQQSDQLLENNFNACGIEIDSKSTTTVEEKISNTVLTELSCDMYEVTQTKSSPQKSDQFFLAQQKDASSQGNFHFGVAEQCLNEYSGSKLNLTSQESYQPVALVSRFPESLRCNENICLEEKDSSHSDLNGSTNLLKEKHCEDNLTSVFDSSIPDQIANSIFREETWNSKSTDDDQDPKVVSNYVEKNMPTINCMENELNTSYMEINRNVVCTNSKNSSSQLKSNHSCTIASSDAVEEVKSNELMRGSRNGQKRVIILTEENGAFPKADYGVANDALAKQITEEEKWTGEEALQQKANKAGTAEDPFDTNVDRCIEHSDSTHCHMSDCKTEEGDCLADLSWTDIMSTFHTYQREESEKCSYQMHDTMSGEKSLLKMGNCGSGDIYLNVNAHSDKDNLDSCTVKISDSLSTSGNILAVVSNRKELEENNKNGRQETTDGKNKLLTRSETFQNTSTLSQIFSSEISQETNTDKNQQSCYTCLEIAPTIEERKEVTDASVFPFVYSKESIVNETLCQKQCTSQEMQLKTSERALFLSNSQSGQDLKVDIINVNVIEKRSSDQDCAQGKLQPSSEVLLQNSYKSYAEKPTISRSTTNRDDMQKSKGITDRRMVSPVMITGVNPSRIGVGFQTALGKHVTVSEKSIEKVKKLFSAREYNTEDNPSLIGAHLDVDFVPCFNPKTVASREVVAAEKMYNCANSPLMKSDDLSNNCNRSEGNSVQHPSAQPSIDSFDTFQRKTETGITTERNFNNAGQPMHLYQGQHSLMKNKQALDLSWSAPEMLTGCKDKPALLEKVKNIQAIRCKQTVPGCVGFQKAREGEVADSTKSLSHAKPILVNSSSVQPSKRDNRNVCKDQTLSMHFDNLKTDKGDKVSASMNSRQESSGKEVFEKVNNLDLNGIATGNASVPMKWKNQGFQTASGKSVCVSESALKNVRTMMDSLYMSDSDILTESVIEGTRESNQLVPGSCDLQTPQGENIKESKEVTFSSLNMFGDCKDLAANAFQGSKQTLSGFQTARGGSVNVSHRSLKHAKKLLQDNPEWSCSSFVVDPEMNSEKIAVDISRNICPASVDRAGASVSDRFNDLSGQQLASSSLVHTSCRGNSSLLQTQGKPDNVSDDCSKLQIQGELDKDNLQPLVSDDHSVLQLQGKFDKDNQQPLVSDDCSVLQFIQEKLDKNNLQPFVSDDCSVLEARYKSEPSYDIVEKEITRVAKKRNVLCTDSEVMMHDRPNKRSRLQPTIADDQLFQKDQECPEMLHSDLPKCSASGKSTFTFQPPYKKPNFIPPVIKNSSTNAGVPTNALQKPGFRPLSVANHFSTLAKAKDIYAVKENCPVQTEPHCGKTLINSSGTENVDQSGISSRSSVFSDQIFEAQTVSDYSTGFAHLQKQPIRNIDQPKHMSGIGLEEARMHQEKIIRQKKTRKVQQVRGRWLNQKSTHKQIKFMELTLSTKRRCLHELLHLGISLEVCSVSSHNAAEFRFYLPAFYPQATAEVISGDGAMLVADKYGYAGKEEFYTAFLTVDGVDPALVTETWVFNHYRWIIWKLAAYEVALPFNFASRALTPDVVMFQLKYRYDREIDNCQRSALKRIVERDDAPWKRLVLCVSDIKHAADSEQTVLELTDGWYCIPCKPDLLLQSLINKKKLVVGQKIITTGAELAGSREACSPLEMCAGLYLNLHGNSTRPAPSTTKLGYQYCPKPLCLPLTSLHPQGGLIGCVDVVVVRKYPLLFMEKLPGGCTFRTLETEENARERYEERRQITIEKLCSQLQAQMEKDEEIVRGNADKRQLNQQEVQALMTGAEISEALETVHHPDELQSMLSSSQIERLMVYRARQQEVHQQCLNERLQQALQHSSYQEERCVVPLLKMRIVGCSKRDIDFNTGLILTVWRPGQDWKSVQEGKRYRIYSLSAAPVRCYRTDQQLEITAGKHTRLEAVTVEENLLDLIYEPREVYYLKDLQEMAPPYGEFDFVGLVFNIKKALRGSDAVYAVDKNGDILIIWFWGGLQAFSLQNLLIEGTAFAASSLQLKSNCKESVECYASLEMSQFSTAGKTAGQRQLLQQYRQKDWRISLFNQGRQKLALRQYSGSSVTPPPQTLEDLPYTFLDSLHPPHPRETHGNRKASSITIQTTNTDLQDKIDSTDASARQNTSVVVSSASQSQSPSASDTKRKQSAQRDKLARLHTYGRAPSLSPLPCVVSPAATSAFKPPAVRRK